MHGQRILTAAVLVPAALFIVFKGGTFLFAVAVCVVAGLCIYEFLKISFPVSWPIAIAGITCSIMPILSVAFTQSLSCLPPVIYLVIFASAAMTLFTYREHDNPLTFMTGFMFGAVYIGLSASFIQMIRLLPEGKIWIFFLFAVIFSGDAGAYYVGRLTGKHRLYPAVSGGKTVEGAIGGLVFNIIAACALWLWMYPVSSYPLPVILLIAVVTGIAGQIGDLAESVIKRSCGVKDSSRILPGHGGVFDRVDALLLAAPLFYLAISMN